MVSPLVWSTDAKEKHTDAHNAQDHKHHDHKHHEHEHNEDKHHDSEDLNVAGIEGASCANSIDVSVNGLVCDFCAQALEKVFGKRSDVEGINVDLNEGKVSIAMKAGLDMDNETFTELITDSGYNVVNIHKGC
jgi:ABC-type Zn2+ transport system substrate-binding protein/surface adhesin